MKILYWILLEVFSFIMAISIYPAFCFYRQKIQLHFLKKLQSKVQLYTEAETNFHLITFINGEKLYSYLIFTIPSLAIFIRCTYADIYESSNGIFLLAWMILIHLGLFLYTYITASQFFHNK